MPTLRHRSGRIRWRGLASQPKRRMDGYSVSFSHLLLSTDVMTARMLKIMSNLDAIIQCGTPG